MSKNTFLMESKQLVCEFDRNISSVSLSWVTWKTKSSVVFLLISDKSLVSLNCNCDVIAAHEKVNLTYKAQFCLSVRLF